MENSDDLQIVSVYIQVVFKILYSFSSKNPYKVSLKYKLITSLYK